MCPTVTQTADLGELPARIGIVAGEGDFPVLIAQGARSLGIDVYVFAVRGLGSDKLGPLAKGFHELKLTDLSRLVGLARENGVYPLNNVYLCISLTEAYDGDGCCHKLVATILSEQPLRD